MYLSHFGLTHAPLGKHAKQLWATDQLETFQNKFQWLLQTPGIGVLTADPGLGKTSCIRHLTQLLNPHQYFIVYVSETDFSRLEFYRQLAQAFNLPPRYRRTQQWKELKERITELMDHKKVLPILIIDEAHNLSHEFWGDFPSFLNFAFDARDMMTVWFLGHPSLDQTLERVAYYAVRSRIQVRHKMYPITDAAQFNAFIRHGFTEAGCAQIPCSDPGIELIRIASQGNPRWSHQIIVAALRMATEKNINHLPDDIIEAAITMLQG